MTEGAADVLGTNFVGAYLQGSFAIGDADEYSDVDFLIPTNAAITTGQEGRLRSMHAGFPERDGPWPRHLEGSYPPSDQLQTLAAAGTEWLYVDNGHKEMERSVHDNSAVVRWSLREFGVVLAGPHPRELIDPVTAEDLRVEARGSAVLVHQWLLESWDVLDDAWTQPFVVATFSRILYTLNEGRVTSKRQALLWGQEHLDPEWSDLLQQASDDRPDPWDRAGRPARPGSAGPTKRFARYALGLAAS